MTHIYQKKGLSRGSVNSFYWVSPVSSLEWLKYINKRRGGKTICKWATRQRNLALHTRSTSCQKKRKKNQTNYNQPLFAKYKCRWSFPTSLHRVIYSFTSPPSQPIMKFYLSPAGFIPTGRYGAPAASKRALHGIFCSQIFILATFSSDKLSWPRGSKVIQYKFMSLA